jgi:hexokinase
MPLRVLVDMDQGFGLSKAVLVADVGGTNARFALARRDLAPWAP